MGTVVKTVRIDLGLSGDALIKAKLDAITKDAEARAKSFPEFTAKINTAAAQQKVQVFRESAKAALDDITKPRDVIIVTEKAKLKLRDIDAEALKLKARWPAFEATINDRAYKAKLAIMEAEAKVTADKISESLSGAGGGGILSKLAGLIPGGGSGAGSILSGAGSSAAGLPWPAIAGIAAAAAAAIPVIVSLATVALGAGAGLAAFGAIGAQSYGKLTSNIAALHTANENFSESADRVDIAIKSSALDSANYHNALAALPPGLRSASVLLGDQNARWQDLTTAQKNNVVALANNKDALKEQLPSQKTALTALLQGKKAWDDMSPAQQAAAANLNKISGAWGKLTTAMEPSVMKVIAAGADQVSKAIGPIGDIAKAAVPGITQMVGILGTGLIGFLKGVQPLIAPSMGALNSILVSVTTSLNKGLAPAMVSAMPQFVKMAELVGKVTGGLILLLGEMVRVSAWMITGFTFAVNIF